MVPLRTAIQPLKCKKFVSESESFLGNVTIRCSAPAGPESQLGGNKVGQQRKPPADHRCVDSNILAGRDRHVEPQGARRRSRLAVALDGQSEGDGQSQNHRVQDGERGCHVEQSGPRAAPALSQGIRRLGGGAHGKGKRHPREPIHASGRHRQRYHPTSRAQHTRDPEAPLDGRKAPGTPSQRPGRGKHQRK